MEPLAGRLEPLAGRMDLLTGADQVVARSETLPSFRVDDAIVAIDRDAGQCFAMNATSARVWELISSPIRVDSLRDSLCDEFDVDPETCLKDVISILSEMQANGLLREAPQA
jgi:hypothetical protein